MRPHQWVKNAFVLIPAVFAGPELLAQGQWTPLLTVQVVLAALAFSLASSATYLLNDIHDIEADRRHPVKCKRPIASGELPVKTAWTLFGALLVVALAMGFWVRPSVAGIVVGYFLVNVAYSKGLKRLAYVDALIIALGFLLRLLAGGEAAQVHLSKWLITCTVLLALFLALGKRKHEVLTSHAGHRKSLERYRVEHLNFALGMLAAATAGAYLAYTVDPSTRLRFHTESLPLTTPFGVFGLLRFYQLSDDLKVASSPTDRMLRDPAFVINALIGAAVIVGLIYGVGGR
jgi:4-hydroxybenzoate polyprenyltransferase